MAFNCLNFLESKVLSTFFGFRCVNLHHYMEAERGEHVGGTVGYTIRLESKTSAATKLLFCTTGILLKRLEVGMGGGGRGSHWVYIGV